MKHFKIKLVNKELNKFKIYERGLLRYREYDEILYDSQDDAYDALEQDLHGLHVMIHLELNQ